MTRGQVVTKALDRFDEIWADHERQSWTRLLALEDDGAEIQFDVLDRLDAEQQVEHARQREAFRAQVEHALDELVREFPIRGIPPYGWTGDR